MKKLLKRIRYENNLQNMSVKDLDKECKLYGYRVELWKYNHKRNYRSDYKYRNQMILHKED